MGFAWTFPMTRQPLPLVSMGKFLCSRVRFRDDIECQIYFLRRGRTEEKEKLKMAAQGINEEEENEEN